ncbi:MAG: hypothetical protein ACPL7D_08650 [Candidatus Sumerlaeaceae bacterium]
MPTIEELLSQSSATPEFTAAVKMVAKTGVSNELVQFSPQLPAVKILRVISQLLECELALAVRRVRIEGFSGCSNFVGKLSVNDGETVYDFDWDCRWRAEEEGWFDAFGFPDQGRAARTFGYRCFRRFEKTPAPSVQAQT